MKVLLDQNAPRGLRAAISGHEIRTALQMGWDELGNGELIQTAEGAGFDVLVTCDQNIRYQQNLAGRRLALVVLGDNRWPHVRSRLAFIQAAIDACEAGSYREVPFERPAPRRRPAPQGPDS